MREELTVYPPDGSAFPAVLACERRSKQIDCIHTHVLSIYRCATRDQG